ncbi:MAG: hypothetical protein ACFFD2_09270 [Promethearchaeota archaeon]
MYFSVKMKIGAGIAGLTALILVIVSIFFVYKVDLGPLSSEDAESILTGLYLLAGAVVVGIVTSLFFSISLTRFKNKTEAFSAEMKYCYSCGTSLQEFKGAETCSKCNAKLKLLKIFDM